MQISPGKNQIIGDRVILRIHEKSPKYIYVDVITKLAQLQISYLVIVKSGINLVKHQFSPTHFCPSTLGISKDLSLRNTEIIPE